MTEMVIQTRDLTKKFGDVTAVNKISLGIEKASIYGFLGPNGCGKSTTIRMLCGLLTPNSGEAQVLGMDASKNAEQLRRRIGYMTQKFSLYGDLTVRENLKFLGQIYAIDKHTLKKRINELLALYELEELSNRYADNMSGGQRQRLALAAATLHQPQLLFLDEPTSAVDPENRRDFWEKLFDLCDQGTSILVSTHYMDEAERCHKLAILERGKLRAEGSPKNLMQDMPANVIEIAGSNLREVKKMIVALENIHAAAQQGMRLRVLVDKKVADPEAFLKQALSNTDLEFSQAHPSLEDVFVLVTHPAAKTGEDER